MLVPLVACGGGGADDRDAAPAPDAPIVVEIDAEVPHECLALASYGAVTFGAPRADGAGTDHDHPRGLTFNAAVDATATPDVLQLELVTGYGAFATADIAPGTYAIADDELDYQTCGVCARLFTDRDASGATAPQQFLATGGTVTITSINPNLAGSVANLTFAEVTIDSTTYHSTPVAYGCASAIDGGAFDVAVTW